MQTKKIILPIFKPNKKIKYLGEICTVEHIHVIGNDLKVKLKEVPQEIDSNNLDCEPTVFVLK